MMICKNVFNNEKGYALAALLAVFGVIAVITIIGLTLIPLAESDSTATAREVQEAQASYTAEAGINDYLWHINKSEFCYRTMVHPAQGNDDSGQPKWREYQDGRYHLDITENTSVPGVTIESTGEITKNNVTTIRKLCAVVTKRSFTQYLYVSDHENLETGSAIWFITGDRIKGPMHSNDIIHISGNPVFEKLVTTGKTFDKQSGSNPQFLEGYKENAPILSMPATNSELKTWAQSNYYYYYGMTTIELLPNGKMIVTNSNTDGPKGTVSLPRNGVVYVDGLTDAKGSANNGDLFVKGTLSGRLTLASKNNIYIAGDLLYNNDQTDMLGLIAENYVYIQHYWSTTGKPPYNKDVAPTDITIKGAIFSIKKSFGFEEFDSGSVKGTIHFTGSIAQQYRGAVGTFKNDTRKTGYSKDYCYDTRMLYGQPPHFISPLNAGFEVVSWEELQ